MNLKEKISAGILTEYEDEIAPVTDENGRVESNFFHKLVELNAEKLVILNYWKKNPTTILNS